MFREFKRRLTLKAISWRFWATIITIVLVYIITEKIEIALMVGGIEVVLKLLMYFLHERIWNNINNDKNQTEPVVIWLTGLSGTGKSTIAHGVYEELKKKGLQVEHLDGDVVRDIFPKTGFTKQERDEHIRRVGFLASMLGKNGIYVVASFIAPYKESRDFVKNLCKNYKEIYISTPIEECKRRDPKGLYSKVDAGEISNFTGIDDPYEVPEKPFLSINTTSLTIKDCISQVIRPLGL